MVHNCIWYQNITGLMINFVAIILEESDRILNLNAWGWAGQRSLILTSGRVSYASQRGWGHGIHVGAAGGGGCQVGHSWLRHLLKQQNNVVLLVASDCGRSQGKTTEGGVCMSDWEAGHKNNWTWKLLWRKTFSGHVTLTGMFHTHSSQLCVIAADSLLQLIEEGRWTSSRTWCNYNEWGQPAVFKFEEKLWWWWLRREEMEDCVWVCI